jgi:hypothetical protein
MTTSCDNIGSTGDGMLPVSCQEQATSVSYPRAMGSLIQTKIKIKEKVIFTMNGKPIMA